MNKYFPLQSLIIPKGFRIIKNNFTTYNPENEFSEGDNLFNLNEDLLQIKLENSNIVVDLGWYGEISTNKGEFRIYVIQNSNWDKPVIIESSKSQETITIRLEFILQQMQKWGE